MNMIKAFNRSIDYIETVLDKEINEKKIERLSGYSYPLFSRLFTILTGTTLAEYIRARRLTRAATELRDGDIKVIDLALKYGYESPDSFGAAFKAFHGSPPSQVRMGKSFRMTPRLQLALSIKGGKNMNVRIEKKERFAVAGIDRRDITTPECPALWDELMTRYRAEEFKAIGSGVSMGVCHDIKVPGKLNYMAGYLCNDIEKAKAMGMDVLEVESTEYAVLELTGPVPSCIIEGWKYAVEVFLPEQGFRHSGKPDFEYYLKGDMTSPDYRMELWIPIEKE